MSERQGIEIDYCPQCRGIWLDRGELDKMIERAGAAVSSPAPQEVRHESHGQKPYAHGKHKRESFLGDLFDF